MSKNKVIEGKNTSQQRLRATILLFVMFGMVIFMSSFINAEGWVSSTWIPNYTINKSLPDIGVNSAPSVFYKDNFWYIIAGGFDGKFYGFDYNSSNMWHPNSTINTSLVDIGDYSSPSVFYKDSTWYLISGTNLGTFYGYKWSGLEWRVNSTINASLPDIGTDSTPSVFYKDSIWYLLAGTSSGKFYGFDYNSSNMWHPNSTINASLPAIPSESSPSVFYKDSTWYLISGANSGTFYGYKYNSSNMWRINSTIISGLPEIGINSAPSVFYKDSTWYLISGANSGTFYGFNYFIDTTPPIVTLPVYTNATLKTSSDTLTYNISVTDDGVVSSCTINIETATLGNKTTAYSDGWCNGTYSLAGIGEGNKIINVYVNDTANNMALNNSYVVFIDSILPTVFLSAGNGTQAYRNSTGNHTINYTITDTNLYNCWINYNSTNRTIPCTSGVVNTTNFTLQYKSWNATLWINESSGRETPSFFNWTYTIFENSNTSNATTYETSSETFSINVTANSSLTAVSLFYNGTYYPTTHYGDLWNVTIDIPSSAVGTQSFNYKFTYGGATSYSDNSSQTVGAIIFTLCNATYADDFLNLSFKDEETDVYINASIPASTFTYYLGSGSVNKTYSLINNTNNYNYLFCATPNLPFKIIPYVQYKQGTDYPQRIWNPTFQTYTSTVENKILYLLSIGAASPVSFQVASSAGQVLAGVFVNVSREVLGVPQLIGEGTTGSDGIVTFSLSQAYLNTLYFTKAGYDTQLFSITPTQSAYTIVLVGGETSQIDDLTYGVTVRINPTASANLYNDTIYGFNMTITTSYYDLDEFGFILKLNNGTVLGSASSVVITGGVINVNLNTSNYTRIVMNYWYNVNGTNTTGTASWIVTNSLHTGWSIMTFFTDLKMYITSGFFGLDNFGLNLIIFLGLFIAVGIMSYRYGITSPMAISTMVFILVFFFDVALGLLDSPIDAIPHTYTWLMGVVTTALIMKEVIQ